MVKLELIENPGNEFKKWSTWALIVLMALPTLLPQLAELGWFAADNVTAGAVVEWAVRLVATWGLLVKFINQTNQGGVVSVLPQARRG